MPKTKSKRAATRQISRAHQAHIQPRTPDVLRTPNAAVRKAAQRRAAQRTGFNGFIHDFPVLSSVLTVAIIAGIVSIFYTNHLGPFAIPVDPCAWARNPASVAVPKVIDRTLPAPKACIVRSTKGLYLVTINVKDKGAVKIAVDQGEAPVTVNNFVYLVSHHFLDGLSFDKATDFVIYSGDPRSTTKTTDLPEVTNKTDGPGYTIADEFPSDPSVYAERSVSMANHGNGTTGSRFFIATGNAAALEPTYNYFGKVTIETFDLAKTIKAGDVITSATVSFDPNGASGIAPAEPTVTPTTAGA